MSKPTYFSQVSTLALCLRVHRHTCVVWSRKHEARGLGERTVFVKYSLEGRLLICAGWAETKGTE